MRCIPMAVLLCASIAATADSQPVRTGDRVRLWTPVRGDEVTVVSAGAIELVVRSDASSTESRIPVSSISRMDVYMGRKSRWAGARRGFLIGGLSLAAVGIVAGVASGDDPKGSFLALTAEEKGIALGLFGMGVGGIAGGVIGAMNPGERWQRARTPAGLALAPARGGAALRVSLAF